MSSGAYQIIRTAIQNKQQVVATTEDGCKREMCPHVIGLKSGKEHALFYQFGGQSKSRRIEATGSPANWRCIDIRSLSNVTIRDGMWHTASDHSKRQTCVDRVDIEVEY